MYFFFFFKQKTAYEMRISDWSSDVCSSDLWPIGDGEAQVDAANALASRSGRQGRKAVDRHREGRAELAAGDIDEIGNHCRCGRPFAGAAPLKEQEIGRAACRDSV